MNWNPRTWFSERPPYVKEAVIDAPNPKSAELIAAQGEVTLLKKRITTVESLLDVALDPDEHLPGSDKQSLYREIISGDQKPDDSGRDFSLQKRMEILRLAHQTYGLRGDAYNLIEIPIDFIVGDDLAPKAKDPEDKKLQKAIDDIWFDPRNELWVETEDYIRSGLLEGELFLIAEMSEEDGHLELAYHPPEQVTTIGQDPRRRDNVVNIQDPDEAGKTLGYFVLNHMDDKVKIDRVDGGGKNNNYLITETTDEGEKSTPSHGLMFVFFNNRPKGATRGRGWLTEVLDYIDIHDELIWSQVEREKLLKLFILEVVAKDVKTQAEAEQKLKEMGLLTPPKDPITICHNDKVDVQIKAPETSGRPTKELEQLLRHNIYGAKGLPEHWSGSGGGSNFATARAQDVVPLRRLRRKQRQVVNFWMMVIKTSIRLRKDKGSLNIKDKPEFDLTYLEVGGRDRQRGASILKDTAVSMAQLVTNQLVKPEAANEIILQVADEAGFKVSPENQGLPPQVDEDLENEFEKQVSNTLANKKRKGSRGEDEHEEDPTDRRVARAV